MLEEDGEVREKLPVIIGNIAPEVGYVAPSISVTAPQVENKTDEHALLAYNDRQRRWIRDRDDNKCQFPVAVNDESYRPCGKTVKLQVHHTILPQRLAQNLGFKPADWDVPGNGLTLCAGHHLGVIHPDMIAANLARGKNSQAYEDMFERRRQLLESGTPYWNTDFDLILERIIDARNQAYMPEHPFPLNRKQQKKLADEGGLAPLPTVTQRDDLLLERRLKMLFGIGEDTPEPTPRLLPGIPDDLIEALFKIKGELVKIR